MDAMIETAGAAATADRTTHLTQRQKSSYNGHGRTTDTAVP